MSIFPTSRPVRGAALFTTVIALPVLLGACGKGGESVSPNTVPSATSPSTGDTRCRSTELRASVGRLDPGAGQRNLPVVLTNDSDRTCTVRGYPGAVFVDASGKRLGPAPQHSEATPTPVELAPGDSAWAGLSFTNPELSEAETATPAELLVTPPDEGDELEVAWEAGEVPVGGNKSSVFLTVLAPGTGP